MGGHLPGIKLIGRKGRALDVLMNDFTRDRGMSQESIDRISEVLSPGEREASTESIAILRSKAFVEAGKPVQSYRSLVKALARYPTSISLQLERTDCLQACHVALGFLLSDDPLSPIIDDLYQILLAESYMGPTTQAQYLKYLLAQGRIEKAVRLARCLVVLYPAINSLRESVEEILVQADDSVLAEYAHRSPVRFAPSVVRTTPSPQRARELLEACKRLQSQVLGSSEGDDPGNLLREIIGDDQALELVDLTLKEFYYLKAVYDGNHGRHWDAIKLLQILVEIDPCSLHFARSLEIEIRRLSNSVEDTAKSGDAKFDCIGAYPVLKEISVLPFFFLKQVCLAEVRQGRLIEARAKMDELCRLNPFDADYLMASIDVALESRDHGWLDILMLRIDSLKSDRPWILNLSAFETDSRKA